MDREPLLKALEAAGVPATPVNTVDQVMEDPQTTARGMVDRVRHPVLGEIPVVSTPVKFSAMRAGVRTPAPVRSQHTDAVLADLGYTPDEIGTLRDKKVIV
jgi:crotonobetainyl-CoA:carnitine CoA-transferase CaiB-like acyl-CoA transferase